MAHSERPLKTQKEVNALTNSSRHVKSKKLAISNVFSAKRLFNLTLLFGFLNIVDFTRLTTLKDVKKKKSKRIYI